MRRLTKAEKLKRGTLDNRHKDPSPGQPLDYIPDSPEWLNDTAKDVFLAVSMDLYDRGLMFDADISLIASYAAETGKYIELTEILNREGYIYTDPNGQKRKHPALIPQRSAYQSIISTAKSLGISPYFRDKITGSVQEQDYEDDPLAGLVGHIEPVG